VAGRYEELERLQRLRESGALSDEEFDAEKRRLLADDPQPEPRARDRTFVYIALGLAAVALAIIAGVWLARDSEADNMAVTANVAAGNAAAAEPPPAIPEPAGPDVKSAAFMAEAFRAATGSAVPIRRRIDGEMHITKPLRVVELPFGPALITSTEIVDGCHACTGALGIYYLKIEGDEVSASGKWPEAIKGWGWGAPPTDWSISDKFAAYPVIVAEGGFMGQGISCGGATLTELRPEGPVESEIVRTSFSNEGAVGDDGTAYGEPPRSLKGKIAGIVRNKSFEVRVTGTDSFTERYVRRGGKFVPQAESSLSC
jgi:putative oligomerization/nucleic acid binding protein